eukprot:403351120
MIRNLFFEDNKFEQISAKSQNKAGSLENNTNLGELDNLKQIQNEMSRLRLDSLGIVSKNALITTSAKNRDNQSTIYSSSQTSSLTNNSPIKSFDSSSPDHSSKSNQRCCYTPVRDQRFSHDTPYSSFNEDNQMSKSHQINSLKHLVEAEEELQSIWKNSNQPRKLIVKPKIIQNQKNYTTLKKSSSISLSESNHALTCQNDKMQTNVNNNVNGFVNPEQPRLKNSTNQATSIYLKKIWRQISNFTLNIYHNLMTTIILIASNTILPLYTMKIWNQSRLTNAISTQHSRKIRVKMKLII